MKYLKRSRLYSQGPRVDLNRVSITELEMYDQKGYLLPAKTLTEYIYSSPTFEECSKFMFNAKKGNKKLNKIWLTLKHYFTNNSYFKTLFPAIKEQKPGKDLYVWIALIQFAIIIYLIPFFTRIERAYINKTSDDFTTNQFSGTMVIAVFIQITIIIIDRYLYLSRKFITIEKQDIHGKEDTTQSDSNSAPSKSFTSVNRISTFNLRNSFISTYIKNKPKEKERENRKQTYIYEQDKTLEEILGKEDPQDDQDEVQGIKLERNVSHRAIILKLYFQIILLIFIHYLVFWYFPNKGNIQIQGHSH